MTWPSPIPGAVKMLAIALASVMSITIVSALPTSGAYAAVACPIVAGDGTTTPIPGPGDDLTGCNLRGANLARVDLNGINLTNTNLTIAILTNTDFTGATLAGANISGTYLKGATLAGANLTNAQLIGSDLGDANMSDAVLTDANLTNADLTNAILVRTTITGTNFSNAIFTGLRGEDLRGAAPAFLPTDWFVGLVPPVGASTQFLMGPSADLSGMTLDGANLSGANLSGADLSGADLSGADLSGADLSASLLERTDLRGANLTGVDFATTRILATIIGDLDPGDSWSYTGAGPDQTGDLAVVGASSLTPVIPATALGRSVTSVGEYAFCADGGIGCTTEPITSINLGSVEAIDEFAFTKTNLASIDLTQVRSIGNWAFARTKLTSLDLKAVRSIGENAFAEITTLSGNLSIPTTVQSLGGGAFRETPFGGSLTLGTGLTSIGVGAFKDSDFSGSLTIPASVTSIGETAFMGNEFTSITFLAPSQLTSIPDEFAAGMVSLSGTLRIPAEVTSIGVEAFSETLVTNTTFPSSLTSIGSRAFSPQRQNRTFTFEGAAPAFGDEVFEIEEDDNSGVITVRYPRGAAGWAAVRAMDPNPFGENVTWVEYVPPTPDNGGGGSQPSPSSPPTVPPPGTEQPDVPIVLPSPSQQPGTITMLIGGKPVTVQDQPLRRGQGLSLSAGPVSMTLRSTTTNGRVVPLATDGSLLLARSGDLPINVSGLAPDSIVTQTLFSDPILLGTATADAAGELASTVTIPPTVPLGSHTLRLQGTTNTGEAFALDVGVTVATPVVALGANPLLTVKQRTVKGKRTLDVRAQGVQSRCLVTFTAGKRKVKTRADRSGTARAQLVVPGKSKRAVNLTARISGKGCAPVQVTRRT